MNLTLPIYWTQTFKHKADKTWLVGMNNYRNWHYFTSNAWKQEYHELITKQLPTSVPLFDRFIMEFALYYKRSCDASNVVPLIEKVVLDTLQAENIIMNDNINYHLSSSWRVIAQDKNNPRCEITIKEYNG